MQTADCRLHTLHCAVVCTAPSCSQLSTAQLRVCWAFMSSLEIERHLVRQGSHPAPGHPSVVYMPSIRTRTHIYIHTRMPAQITWCLICITSCHHWSDIDTSGSTSTTHIDTPRPILFSRLCIPAPPVASPSPSGPWNPPSLPFPFWPNLPSAVSPLVSRLVTFSSPTFHQTQSC